MKQFLRHLSSFRVVLGCIVASAFAFRVGYVLFEGVDPLPFSDGLSYHIMANAIADGLGFVKAGELLRSNVSPTAQFPPLFPLLLSGVSWLGFRSTLAHQITCCALSTGAVGVVGLLGRRVGDERVGLVSAGLAALYPPMWQSDALVASESLFALTVALVLLAAYRFWDRRDIGAAALLGGAIAMAALTRQEALLFIPLLAVPLALRVRGVGRRRRVEAALVIALVCFALIAPWTIRNLRTFERPVLLSQNFDSVVAGANCEPAYRGPGVGSWNLFCNVQPEPRGDESQRGAVLRQRGTDYLRAHIGRLPVVVAARVGRTWDVFRPLQYGGYDLRPSWLLRLSVGAHYALLPLALAGVVLLVKQRRLVLPLIASGLIATLVTALAYGVQRFRLSWDVASLVLGSIAIDFYLRKTRIWRSMPAQTGRYGS